MVGPEHVEGAVAPMIDFVKGGQSYTASYSGSGELVHLFNKTTGKEIPWNTKTFRLLADGNRGEKFKIAKAPGTSSPAKAEVVAKKKVRDMTYREAEQLVLNAAHNSPSHEQMKKLLAAHGFDVRTYAEEKSFRKGPHLVTREISVMGPKREKIFATIRTGA